MKKICFDTPLLDQLIAYCKHPKAPFHMPGHAGGKNIHPKILGFFGSNIFKADLTELDELDNLNTPEGIILETQEKIARIFNAKVSYLLVNGSTSGLMALIISYCKKGDKILVPRNAHRSIINALILSGATPVWYLPEWLKDWELFGRVYPESFDEHLENTDNIKVALVVSPTYEGIVSDIRSLSSICHKYGIPLIVDEAHGGHFKFSNKFPDNALDSGADAVVQSFHKSCGSLSQSSLLHLSMSSLLSARNVEESLRLLQTTSPSYLLMASLDAATSYLASPEGSKHLENIFKLSLELRENLTSINNIELLSISDNLIIDPTRLFIKINQLSGNNLAEIIESKYHIAIESLNNLGNLFFLNLGNSRTEVNKLYQSLKEIASESHSDHLKKLPCAELPKMILTPREAYFSNSECIPMKSALGRIARFPIVKCPPGIAVIIPGEKITDYHLNFLGENDFIDVVKN